MIPSLEEYIAQSKIVNKVYAKNGESLYVTVKYGSDLPTSIRFSNHPPKFYPNIWIQVGDVSSLTINEMKTFAYHEYKERQENIHREQYGFEKV